MSKTILFVSGPFDGLVIDAEKIETIPARMIQAHAFRVIHLYRRERGTWWQYSYLLKGNVAVYTQGSNRTHTTEAAYDPRWLSKNLGVPHPKTSDQVDVECLIADPRTFTEDGTS